MREWSDLTESAKLKVEKMFQAVIELLDEGCDSHTIKVSDVTNRAGIGKGTAYEYFDSRDEIIAASLEYDTSRRFALLYEEVSNMQDFHGMVEAAFTWIDQNLHSKGSGIEFFKARENSFDISRAVAERTQNFNYSESNMKKVLEHQINTAVQEKLCPDAMPWFFAESIMLSAYVEYFMFIIHRNQHTNVTDREMRDFIYDGMVNRLAHFKGHVV